jgi:hypothetical protein
MTAIGLTEREKAGLRELVRIGIMRGWIMLPNKTNKVPARILSPEQIEAKRIYNQRRRARLIAQGLKSNGTIPKQPKDGRGRQEALLRGRIVFTKPDDARRRNMKTAI